MREWINSVVASFAYKYNATLLSMSLLIPTLMMAKFNGKNVFPICLYSSYLLGIHHHVLKPSCHRLCIWEMIAMLMLFARSSMKPEYTSAWNIAQSEIENQRQMGFHGKTYLIWFLSISKPFAATTVCRLRDLKCDRYFENCYGTYCTYALRLFWRVRYTDPRCWLEVCSLMWGICWGYCCRHYYYYEYQEVTTGGLSFFTSAFVWMCI